MSTELDGLSRIENQTFRDAVVELDSKHFVKCNFFNCFLSYSGNPAKITECGFSPHGRPEFKLVGAAMNTMLLLRQFGYISIPLSHATDAVS